jgi:store-operated calcium entry-associated regulatory factor
MIILKRGEYTASRRVAPVPQLSCVGGSARGEYEPDTVLCRNLGSGNVRQQNTMWKCEAADMPEEYKLGRTEVVCEGYEHSDDQ